MDQDMEARLSKSPEPNDVGLISADRMNVEDDHDDAADIIHTKHPTSTFIPSNPSPPRPKLVAAYYSVDSDPDDYPDLGDSDADDLSAPAASLHDTSAPSSRTLAPLPKTTLPLAWSVVSATLHIDPLPTSSTSRAPPPDPPAKSGAKRKSEARQSSPHKITRMTAKRTVASSVTSKQRYPPKRQASSKVGSVSRVGSVAGSGFVEVKGFRCKQTGCGDLRRVFCPHEGCDVFTNGKGDMARHLLTKKHRAASFECPTCPTVFTRNDALTRHLRNSSCKRARSKPSVARR
ncbi:hypothetical protein PLICRDRAFT_39772 [Plicaturopsis crispa FD-325 SS-3]|nr:hypothetical protein PLICRDRAFT_39772 [Plicaturopsis crispa FD-325 SS-3]